MAGCRSTAEAERYLGRKRKRESEEGMNRGKESSPVQASSSYVNDLDMIGFNESQLLSESVSCLVTWNKREIEFLFLLL